jgi:hypothetical protein
MNTHVADRACGAKTRAGGASTEPPRAKRVAGFTGAPQDPGPPEGDRNGRYKHGRHSRARRAGRLAALATRSQDTRSGSGYLCRGLIRSLVVHSVEHTVNDGLFSTISGCFGTFGGHKRTPRCPPLREKQTRAGAVRLPLMTPKRSLGHPVVIRGCPSGLGDAARYYRSVGLVGVPCIFSHVSESHAAPVQGAESIAGANDFGSSTLSERSG